MKSIPLAIAATLLLASSLALSAACSDDGGSDTPAPADAATATAAPSGDDPAGQVEPTAAGEPDFTLSGSEVQGALSSTYHTGQSAPPTDDQLPFPPNTVIARWYQSDGFYVVHYDGLSLDVTGPLCPGNSIQTASGFEFISNAPSGPGACTGATTLVGPPTGVLLCESEVLYRTAIPVGTEGTLYGTVEVYNPDGSIVGLTSMAPAIASAAPEIDVSGCELVEA